MVHTFYYINFFYTIQALLTKSSWLSLVRPMSFLALNALKLALNYENTSSIGLYL